MSISSLKKYLSTFKKEYLYSKLRRFEFTFCIVANIALFIILSNMPIEKRTFVGQMQGFVSVYMAFRFGIIGMLISNVLSIKDISILTIAYLNFRSPSQLAGLVFTILTIVCVSVIGIISTRQDKHRREMQRIAITDDLTNVFNQRFLYSTLDAQIKSFSKTGNSIGLILIDIDNFKMLNDLYGLNFGDKILKSTASVLKKIVDKDDSIYRFG